MIKVNLLKKSGVVGIIIIFICASFVSSIGGYSEDTTIIVDTDTEDVCESQENVLVTCSTYGFPGEPSQETSMSQSDAESLYDKIKELQIEIARDPLSDKTQQLQHEIIILADEHNLLPAGLSVKTLKSRLTPTLRLQRPKLKLPRLQNTASEMFCNYVSTGSGSALPIIILPRLLPILLSPIPRLFVRWSTLEGLTSCGGLRSGTGFIAYGAQNGIALGFWGIGFSIFLPPVMAYGLFGYALYASVNAEEIEWWPPNWSPEVTIISPLDGAENVPVSTSELAFQIKDDNDDLMNYTVTTDPDIGSGSGNNKPDGTYTVPISGLEGTEEYTWHIQVNDGVNVVEVSSSFTTEAVAPVVSNPSPPEGARNTPVDLSQLSFHLSDPQGDLMDYTVETSPDIGSGSGSGVGDGTYSVDVSGVDYSTDYAWYVNVTDGMYWKHKVFSFKTRPLPGPWWNDSWPYRKEIIVNYAKVGGNFDNFPVLIKLESDADLASKAQSNGNDIVFTNYSGFKLNHEIELYNDEDGELIAWVNVPNLTPDAILYTYYGNPICSNQQNIEATWDSNYVGVWHMNDLTASITLDSKYDNDGYKNTIQCPGAIGYGQRFDATRTNSIDCGNDPTLHGLSGTNEFTLECWVKTSMSTSGRFFNKDDWDPGSNDKRGWYWSIRDTTHKAGGYASENDAGSGTWQEYNWGTTVNDGIWHYQTLKITWPGGSGLAYYIRDGNSPIPDTMGIDFINPIVDTFDLEIGGNKYALEHGQPASLHGDMDECRISKIARSDAWLLTSYNTQSDPSSFLSFGPEETEP